MKKPDGRKLREVTATNGNSVKVYRVVPVRHRDHSTGWQSTLISPPGGLTIGFQTLADAISALARGLPGWRFKVTAVD